MFLLLRKIKIALDSSCHKASLDGLNFFDKTGSDSFKSSKKKIYNLLVNCNCMFLILYMEVRCLVSDILRLEMLFDLSDKLF